MRARILNLTNVYRTYPSHKDVTKFNLISAVRIFRYEVTE